MLFRSGGRESWRGRGSWNARPRPRPGGVASCRGDELGPRRGSTGEQRLAGGACFGARGGVDTRRGEGDRERGEGEREWHGTRFAMDSTAWSIPLSKWWWLVVGKM